MTATLRTGDFEGPLDLLLQLVTEQKLPITEVALATVTEQYFAYLKTLPESQGRELADFLVIATKLVYLKSRELLPSAASEEEDGASLADQLRLYQRFVAASKQVLALWQAGRVAYGRVEPLIKNLEFILPANARGADLQTAFNYLLARLKPVAPLPEVAIDRSITIRERIQKIFDWLKKLKRVSFRELFRGAKSKTEVIVGFLALLELVKQEKIAISQNAAFADMEIKPV